MVKKLTTPPKQLNPGRPREAENMAKLETPKIHNSELPKEIIGSHMGSYHGPAIKSPPKPAKLGPKAPPK